MFDFDDDVDEMLEAEAEYLAEVAGDLGAIWPPMEDLADQAWDASAEAALEAADARAQAQITGPEGWALARVIMESSEADTWAHARMEWDVVGCEDSGSAGERCVCGHEGIRYLHTVENRLTGEVIFPIGSTCVEKFDSADMLVRSRELRGVRRIEEAVHAGTLSHQSFSKRGIDGLWREGIVTGLAAAMLHRGFLEWSRKSITEYTAQEVSRIVSEEIIPALTRRTDETAATAEGGTR